MKKRVTILVVEDNPGDQRLISESLGTSTQSNLHIVSDGASALEFVRKEGKFRNSPRPQLILLDQNLPRKSGQEVLREIKSDPQFRDIPIVMLSSASRDADVRAAYDLHANSYVIKPIELDDFFSALRAIEHYWTSVVVLPQ